MQLVKTSPFLMLLPVYAICSFIITELLVINYYVLIVKNLLVPKLKLKFMFTSFFGECLLSLLLKTVKGLFPLLLFAIKQVLSASTLETIKAIGMDSINNLAENINKKREEDAKIEAEANKKIEAAEKASAENIKKIDEDYNKKIAEAKNEEEKKKIQEDYEKNKVNALAQAKKDKAAAEEAAAKEIKETKRKIKAEKEAAKKAAEEAEKKAKKEAKKREEDLAKAEAAKSEEQKKKEKEERERLALIEKEKNKTAEEKRLDEQREKTAKLLEKFKNEQIKEINEENKKIIETKGASKSELVKAAAAVDAKTEKDVYKVEGHKYLAADPEVCSALQKQFTNKVPALTAEEKKKLEEENKEVAKATETVSEKQTNSSALFEGIPAKAKAISELLNANLEKFSLKSEKFLIVDVIDYVRQFKVLSKAATNSASTETKLIAGGFLEAKGGTPPDLIKMMKDEGVDEEEIAAMQEELNKVDEELEDKKKERQKADEEALKKFEKNEKNNELNDLANNKVARDSALANAKTDQEKKEIYKQYDKKDEEIKSFHASNIKNEKTRLAEETEKWYNEEKNKNQKILLASATAEINTSNMSAEDKKKMNSYLNDCMNSPSKLVSLSDTMSKTPDEIKKEALEDKKTESENEKKLNKLKKVANAMMKSAGINEDENNTKDSKIKEKQLSLMSSKISNKLLNNKFGKLQTEYTNNNKINKETAELRKKIVKLITDPIKAKGEAMKISLKQTMIEVTTGKPFYNGYNSIRALQEYVEYVLLIKSIKFKKITKFINSLYEASEEFVESIPRIFDIKKIAEIIYGKKQAEEKLKKLQESFDINTITNNIKSKAMGYTSKIPSMITSKVIGSIMPMLTGFVSQLMKELITEIIKFLMSIPPALLSYIISLPLEIVKLLLSALLSLLPF